MVVLQAQQKVSIYSLRKKKVFLYSIAPPPLLNIYTIDTNNLKMEMQKYLEKYKKVHTDTTSLTVKSQSHANAFGFFWLFLFLLELQ